MAGKRGDIKKLAKDIGVAIEELGIGLKLGLRPVNHGACTGEWISCEGGQELTSVSPVDGSPLATVRQADERGYEPSEGAETEQQTREVVASDNNGIKVEEDYGLFKVTCGSKIAYLDTIIRIRGELK